MMNVQNRTDELQGLLLNSNYRKTDRLFMGLMIVQAVGGVVAALVLSPRTYVGSNGFVHPHVIFALILGILIATPAIAATLIWPGTRTSRYTVAVCQPLMSALLIHISGGRIETHFHVFGSLAFLAFYRDWKVLVPATLVVALDHMVRGVYAPLSVYGIPGGAEWRFLEHAGWVAFEDVILVASCLRSVNETRAVAERQAQLEATNESVEAAIVARTDELRQTELRNSAVLEHALDAIVSTDKDGKIVQFNPAAQAIFGYTEAEAQQMTLCELLGSDECRQAVKSSLEGDSKVAGRHVEVCGLKANGETFPIEISVTCLALNETTYTAFIRDASERKRLESKVSQANKLESLGQLATGVAHEINTPNQYIGDNVRYVDESFGEVAKLIESYRSVVEDVEAGKLPIDKIEAVRSQEDTADLEFITEEIPRALTQALEGVERVASIVQAMKEFSHPGIQSLTMVDLNRVVTSTVTVARNEWKYVAEIDIDLEQELPPIQGNPGELGQVILNLVVNAAHAIRDKFSQGEMGRIRISTKSDERYVTLRIGDNGGGIPENVQKRMFDPFFTTKGVGIGTGQGLAIVHAAIVNNHGGEIEVDSVVGEGTEFIVKIPLDGRAVASDRDAA